MLRAPPQDRLAILAKDADARRERQQLAAAASAEMPSAADFVDAYFGLRSQVEKLERIEQRLERMAVAA